jgi:hypothetical protein
MLIEYFFIAGAQRSGTSYLYCLLAEHPEIEMAKPIRPEPKFFLIDALFERGLEYYKNHFFEGKEGAWRRGEKSVSYMESEKVAERIARYFPEAKLLFLLRDPVERAISNYWFSVNNGLETMSMSEAFLHEEERWLDYDHQHVSASPYAYLRRGRYIDYISTYEHYFPPENIKVILLEQLVKSINIVTDLYAFLGVAPDFMPATYDQIINRGDKPSYILPLNLEYYIIDYFAETNACLAERFGLDLTAWRRL